MTNIRSSFRMPGRIAAALVASFAGLFWGTEALAAGPAILNVTVDNVTKSGARLVWQTGTTNTAPSRILFGTSAAYGSVVTVPDGSGNKYHPWFLSGLAPDTVYHFCPQSTDATGVSPCDGTANDYTFRTSAGPAAPEEPQRPTRTVDTTYTAPSGRVLKVDSRNCNDPVAGLQAQINAAQLGDTIEIPAGMVCEGTYIFPAKTLGSGWIVVRTSTPDGQLPPPGTRVTASDKPLLATIVNTGPVIQAYGGAGGDACQIERGFLASPYGLTYDPAVLGLFRCTNNVWTRVVPAAIGDTVPSSCQVGDWFQKTGETSLENRRPGWWCTTPNHYTPITIGNNGDPWGGSALHFYDGAHHYRLIGLEVTVLPTPPGETFLQYPSLITSQASTHHLIVDRCYLHGLGYPSRLLVGVRWEGSDVAIVDTTIAQVNVWQRDDAYELTSQAVLVDRGPGPGKLSNNTLDAVGITFFVTENAGPSIADPADYEVKRNLFTRSETLRSGSPGSDGHNYFNRHQVELKRGRRFVFEGNIFENNWSYIQQGDMITLTPRAGSFAGQNPDTQIADILFDNNVIQHTAMAFGMTGHDMSSGDGRAMTKILQRVKISNNVIRTVDGAYTVSGYPYATFGAGRWTNVFWTGFGPEDLWIEHNTITDIRQAPGFQTIPFPMFGIDGDDFSPGANLSFRNNIMDYGDRGFSTAGLEGSAALNFWWKNTPAAGWVVDHNVFVGNTAKATLNPPSNAWAESDSTLGFANVTGGDFTLAGGSYQGTGSDGRDPGVDMPALQTAIQHTRDGAWSGSASGGGVIAACDLNRNGSTDVLDVQLAANQVLGVAPCLNAGDAGSADINSDGSCTVIDLQRIVNAALTGTCVSP